MAQTLPTPDLISGKQNKSGTSYDASLLTKWFKEEYDAIRGRLVTAEYSVNSFDLWIGGTETITSNRDFIGRQIACSGTVGAIPWAAGPVGGIFAYYAGKQAIRMGVTTGTQWDDANIGNRSVAFGVDAMAKGSDSFAWGDGSEAQSPNGLALGQSAIVLSGGWLALGNAAQSGGVNAQGIGAVAEAMGDGTTALGHNVQSQAIHPGAITIGGDDSFTKKLLSIAAHSLAIGFLSNVPSLYVGPGDGTNGSVGLVGIGLGATAPTKAYLEIKASTTSFASLNLAHGSAPSAPNNGDIWTTTAGVYARVNGATVGPLIDASTGDITAVNVTAPITGGGSSGAVTVGVDTMVGDSGAGGARGVVPAPATGDASKFLRGDATWQSVSSAFSAITSATNTTAAMIVGTGASLTVSGSGTINATTLGGATFAAPGTIGGGTPGAATFTSATVGTTLALGSLSVPSLGGAISGNNDNKIYYRCVSTHSFQDDAGNWTALLAMGRPVFNGTNSTGSTTALLGTNSPAVTGTAPYTWITVTTSDGSTGYIPIWK